MLTPKSTGHIRTSRNVKSFRSCRHMTGVRMIGVELGQIAVENERLAGRERRRRWLAEQWREHLLSAKGSLNGRLRRREGKWN